MNKLRPEQKIFPHHHSTVEVCGRCGGHGRVLVYPEGDIWKQKEPEEVRCPLCEGSGMVRKTTTITIDLKPFKQGQP